MGTAPTTGTLTQLMKTYYDRKLLEFAEPVMVADKLADHSRDIPQKEGKSVNFTRLVPLSKITTATTEGSNPEYVEMEAFEFEKTSAKYSNSIQLTDTLQLTAYSDVLSCTMLLLAPVALSISIALYSSRRSFNPSVFLSMSMLF